MKFILIFVIALVVLSVSEAGRVPQKKKDFCSGQERSNGSQLAKGSCSTGIQGKIPSSDKMPSTIINSPENGAVLKPNEKFSVDFVMSNIETGHFSDPEKDYNIEPQDLNSDGLILGHTHVTIQKLKGRSPPDSQIFAFFKGVNDKADSKGRLSVDVVREDGKPGLPPGFYRICTMAGSFSHQPLIMPVAKRGKKILSVFLKTKKNIT